ncbi:MAG: hypothetical protein Fur009_0010 [Candidatus Microgenomates bacterium]
MDVVPVSIDWAIKIPLAEVTVGEKVKPPVASIAKEELVGVKAPE